MVHPFNFLGGSRAGGGGGGGGAGKDDRVVVKPLSMQEQFTPVGNSEEFTGFEQNYQSPFATNEEALKIDSRENRNLIDNMLQANFEKTTSSAVARKSSLEVSSTSSGPSRKPSMERSSSDRGVLQAISTLTEDELETTLLDSRKSSHSADDVLELVDEADSVETEEDRKHNSKLNLPDASDEFLNFDEDQWPESNSVTTPTSTSVSDSHSKRSKQSFTKSPFSQPSIVKSSRPNRSLSVASIFSPTSRKSSVLSQGSETLSTIDGFAAHQQPKQPQHHSVLEAPLSPGPNLEPSRKDSPVFRTPTGNRRAGLQDFSSNATSMMNLPVSAPGRQGLGASMSNIGGGSLGMSMGNIGGGSLGMSMGHLETHSGQSSRRVRRGLMSPRQGISPITGQIVPTPTTPAATAPMAPNLAIRSASPAARRRGGGTNADPSTPRSETRRSMMDSIGQHPVSQGNLRPSSFRRQERLGLQKAASLPDFDSPTATPKTPSVPTSETSNRKTPRERASTRTSGSRLSGSKSPRPSRRSVGVSPTRDNDKSTDRQNRRRRSGSRRRRQSESPAGRQQQAQRRESPATRQPRQRRGVSDSPVGRRRAASHSGISSLPATKLSGMLESNSSSKKTDSMTKSPSSHPASISSQSKSIATESTGPVSNHSKRSSTTGSESPAPGGSGSSSHHQRNPADAQSPATTTSNHDRQSLPPLNTTNRTRSKSPDEPGALFDSSVRTTESAEKEVSFHDASNRSQRSENVDILALHNSTDTANSRSNNDRTKSSLSRSTDTDMPLLNLSPKQSPKPSVKDRSFATHGSLSLSLDTTDILTLSPSQRKHNPKITLSPSSRKSRICSPSPSRNPRRFGAETIGSPPFLSPLQTGTPQQPQRQDTNHRRHISDSDLPLSPTTHDNETPGRRSRCSSVDYLDDMEQEAIGEVCFRAKAFDTAATETTDQPGTSTDDSPAEVKSPNSESPSDISPREAKSRKSEGRSSRRRSLSSSMRLDNADTQQEQEIDPQTPHRRRSPSPSEHSRINESPKAGPESPATGAESPESPRRRKQRYSAPNSSSPRMAVSPRRERRSTSSPGRPRGSSRSPVSRSRKTSSSSGTPSSPGRRQRQSPDRARSPRSGRRKATLSPHGVRAAVSERRESRSDRRSPSKTSQRRLGDSQRLGDSHRFGDSQRFGGSQRFGDSQRLSDSHRFGDSQRLGDSHRFGDSQRLGDSVRLTTGDGERRTRRSSRGAGAKHRSSSSNRKQADSPSSSNADEGGVAASSRTRERRHSGSKKEHVRRRRGSDYDEPEMPSTMPFRERSRSPRRNESLSSSFRRKESISERGERGDRRSNSRGGRRRSSPSKRRQPTSEAPTKQGSNRHIRTLEEKISRMNNHPSHRHAQSKLLVEIQSAGGSVASAVEEKKATRRSRRSHDESRGTRKSATERKVHDSRETRSPERRSRRSSQERPRKPSSRRRLSMD